MSALSANMDDVVSVEDSQKPVESITESLPNNFIIGIQFGKTKIFLERMEGIYSLQVPMDLEQLQNSTETRIVFGEENHALVLDNGYRTIELFERFNKSVIKLSKLPGEGRICINGEGNGIKLSTLLSLSCSEA